MSNRAKFLCWLLLPVSYAVVLLGSLLWNSELALLFRDIGSLTLPAKHAWVESVRAFGELPQWNPLVVGGAPFLADPSFATYHPLNFVFLLFPTKLLGFAHTWYLALHLPLAFAGYFIFFRRLSGQAFFGALAALAMACSGQMVSGFYQSGSLGGIAAAGWLFYFWWRYLESGRIGFLAASSFFLVLPVYCGDPQWSYLLAVFFLPAFAFGQVSPRSAVGALLRLFGLALLAASPQLLPTLDLLFETKRSLGASTLTTTETWSLHPLRLLEWFFPFPFGSDLSAWARWPLVTNGPDPMPFVFSLYPGFVFFPALLAVIPGKNRQKFFWLALTLFFLWAACGLYVPISLNHLLGKLLPVWSSFRFPERLVVFAQLAVLLAIAQAVRSLGPEVFFRRLAWGVFFSCALVGLCAFFRYPEPIVRTAGLSGLLFFVWAALTAARKIPLAAGAIGLVAITYADLGFNLRQMIWPVPAKFISVEGSPFAQLLEQRIAAPTLESSPRLLVTGGEKINWSLIDRLGGESLSFPGKLSVHQLLMLQWNTANLFRVGSPLGNVTLLSQRQLRFWNEASLLPDGRAFGLKGVQFIGRASDFSLQTNPDALPLFSVPRGIDFVADDREALKKISDPSWDWRHQIVVQGEGKPQGTAELSFTLKKRTYNRLEVRVRATAASPETWVLWNESFDRNWSLEAKNEWFPLARANYWASAFRVPVLRAGEEIDLHFSYVNPLVRLGQALFWVWGLLVALLLFREKRKGAR